MSKEKVISIGRDPSNTVVLSEANVSSFHARLTQTTDQIVLDDLGSTNGTSVGHVENKVRTAPVTLDDMIFFGSSSYRVSDFVDSPNRRLSSEAKATPTARKESGQSERRFTRTQVALAIGAAVSALAALGLIATSLLDNELTEVPGGAGVTERDREAVESSVPSNTPSSGPNVASEESPQ